MCFDLHRMNDSYRTQSELAEKMSRTKRELKTVKKDIRMPLLKILLRWRVSKNHCTRVTQ